MGNPASGTGLPGQWGVNPPGQNQTQTNAPADTGSDQQKLDFQAAFQGEQGAINDHLQYTSANAEAAKHAPLAARRDALYTAFQSALASIDRNNPAKGQPFIVSKENIAGQLVQVGVLTFETSGQITLAAERSNPASDQLA